MPCAPWSSIPPSPTTDEPVERIFGILAGYRDRILQTECRYGCPLGRLALEIDPENRPAHKLIAENFQGWITAVRECIDQLKPRLPKGTDPEALATYVLAVMEGGVMISRSYGSVDPFDRAVKQLRQHFALLLTPQNPKPSKTKRTKHKALAAKTRSSQLSVTENGY